MRKGRGRKHDKTGRSQNHQYWNLSYSFGQSDAVRCLSGPALKILVELRCRYNGYNNGKITLSYEEAARFLGLSKSSVKRAFDELIQVGFIKLKKLGALVRAQGKRMVAHNGSRGRAPSNERMDRV